MFLTPYVSSSEQKFQFTREQASLFAKKVAGDFNPIHNPENKRFCVPGDLLFAVLLSQQGICKKMRIEFSGMVSDGVPLHIEHQSSDLHALLDDNGKEYLRMFHDGETNNDPELIEHVTTNYVQFSGMNFPHIMVPLMEQQQMMINSQRPLVIYESMEVEFNRLDLKAPTVELTDATFDVEGKRGVVTMKFSFTEHDQIVGHGQKKMVASGLKPYDAKAIEGLVQYFYECRDAFLAQTDSSAN